MPYATLTDLTNLYSSAAVTVVADRDRSGAPDAAAVDAALQDATSLMDSYIGARYDLPLTVESNELRRACVDIAMYRMAGDAATATDEARKRYEDALHWLRDVASGKASLGQVSEPVTLAATVEVGGPERECTRETLRGL